MLTWRETMSPAKSHGYGLYDILGNVWEWVEDCWHPDYTDAPSAGEVRAGGEPEPQSMTGIRCVRTRVTII